MVDGHESVASFMLCILPVAVTGVLLVLILQRNTDGGYIAPVEHFADMPVTGTGSPRSII